MADLLVLSLILAMVGHSSGTWCVCKDGLSDAALQKTLDYACGAGADCTSIHQNGGCYNPNTVRAHCSYAVNSFFQRKAQAQGTCDFAGTATLTASDPSSTGCAYPASASASSNNTTLSTTPSSTTPSTTTPLNGNSPYLTTPTGVLGPSGNGINTDVSSGDRVTLHRTSFLSSLFIISLVL
ncbi:PLASMODESMATA CALLOSE-BINDING PROTEIN 2 [Sarracenia purpurea var. burkii]